MDEEWQLNEWGGKEMVLKLLFLYSKMENHCSSNPEGSRVVSIFLVCMVRMATLRHMDIKMKWFLSFRD